MIQKGSIYQLLDSLSIACLLLQNKMKQYSPREENTLPSITRSRADFLERSPSASSLLTNSNHKFKSIETAVWTHNGKEIIKKDQITEIDKRLNTDLRTQKNNSTEYLISLRKAHDEMIKNALKKEVETKKLKEQIDSMKRNIEIYSRQADLGRKEIEGLQKNFSTIKTKQQLSAMAGKTLEHILARMKSDEIVYHKKINDYEKKVKYLQGSMVEFQHKKYHLNEFEALSTIAAKEVKGSYNQCNQRRKKDMQQYESLMRKKRQSDRKQQERQKITDEIQAIAASDFNDSSLLKWKKLLMVQLLLKKILKSKINNLEVKYGDMKNAFHTIKIKTTIDDPKNLAIGYFKLEEDYNGLVNIVKNLEATEKQLTDQKELSEKQLDRLNNQFNDITDKCDKSHMLQDDDELLRLSKQKEVSERSFLIKLIEQKIYSWLIQNRWKLQGLKQKTQTEKRKFTESHNKENMEKYMGEFCVDIQAISAALQKETQNQPSYLFGDLQNLEVVTNTPRVDTAEEELKTTESERRFKKKTARA